MDYFQKQFGEVIHCINIQTEKLFLSSSENVSCNATGEIMPS